MGLELESTGIVQVQQVVLYEYDTIYRYGITKFGSRLGLLAGLQVRDPGGARCWNAAWLTGAEG